MRIRLAVVDDSSFVRKALVRMLHAEPGIEVVGAAASGEELLENLARWRPDIVTLDLEMPGMGGLATLDRLQAERPIPVVIFSTQSEQGASLAVEALYRTAVDFVDKAHVSLMDFAALRKRLVEKILQLVAAGNQRTTGAARPAAGARAQVGTAHAASPGTGVDVVLIGASTGGPPAIQRILEDLGGALAVPVLIVQHMPTGFTAAFAKRLDAQLPMSVREAAHGDALRPGVVYIAPAGANLTLRRRAHEVVAVLDDTLTDSSHRPSVDVLFHSACRVYRERAVAILLTGMGSDGAAGLAALAREGSFTIGQSEATCVVYGMPRVAQSLGAVAEELDVGDIGRRVAELLGVPAGR